MDKLRAVKVAELQERKAMLRMATAELEGRLKEVMDLVQGFVFVHGRGVMEEPQEEADEARQRKLAIRKGVGERRCEFCSLQKCGVF